MYHVKSLEEGIKKCDVNIVIFEDAIKKERATQENYRQMINGAKQEGDIGFNTESLEGGIKKCDASIVIFEEAIKKERATQEEHRQMVKEAERMEEKRDGGESSISSIAIGGVEIKSDQNNNNTI